MFGIKVTRQEGRSTMGHFFPAESRMMKSEGEVMQFETELDAQAIADHYRQQPASGFTAKTYAVVRLNGESP